MKLRYFSDLHLEHKSKSELSQLIKKIIIRPDDVCIIAGDLCEAKHPNYSSFMRFIDNNFKKTFIVPGNHEYYGGSISDINKYLRHQEHYYENVHILINDCVKYDGYNFIGSTLWSKIYDTKIYDTKIYDTKIYDINITADINVSNDFKKIKGLDIITRNALHKQSRDFICTSLHNGSNNNNIIITHHVPSRKLINAKYKTPQFIPWHDWYYADMDDIIIKNNIKCWFYGNIHTADQNIFAGCHFLCNPTDNNNVTHVIE